MPLFPSYNFADLNFKSFFMQSTHYNLILFILASAVLILLMAGFIVTILFLYKKKQLAYFQTIEELKLDYEKNLLHTQLEIQEQTLQHISREIHDNINLSLTLAKLNLNTLDWRHSARARTQIDSSLQQISKAITDLGNISKGMNSELITNQGLMEVLKKETDRLKELDLFFSERVNKAHNLGNVLRFVGSIEKSGKCSVKIEEINSNNPLYKVKNGENALTFYTNYYQPIPLVLRGYGAGNDVTASGVFSDLLRTIL